MTIQGPRIKEALQSLICSCQHHHAHLHSSHPEGGQYLEEHQQVVFMDQTQKGHALFQLTLYCLEPSHMATYNDKGVWTWTQAVCQREDGFGE